MCISPGPYIYMINNWINIKGISQDYSMLFKYCSIAFNPRSVRERAMGWQPLVGARLELWSCRVGGQKYSKMNRDSRILDLKARWVSQNNWDDEARCTLVNVGTVKVQVTVAWHSQFQSMSSNGVNSFVWFLYATFPDKPVCLSQLPNLPQAANSQRQSRQEISSRAWNWKSTTSDKQSEIVKQPDSFLAPVFVGMQLIWLLYCNWISHSAPQGWSWDYNQTGICCSTVIWKLVPQWWSLQFTTMTSKTYWLNIDPNIDTIDTNNIHLNINISDIHINIYTHINSKMQHLFIDTLTDPPSQWLSQRGNAGHISSVWRASHFVNKLSTGVYDSNRYRRFEFLDINSTVYKD